MTLYGVLSWVSGDITSASNAATYVENTVAQPSANWRSGGLCQRPVVLKAAPERRQASADQPLGPR